MHIKDLKVDVELDSAALGAIRGGSSMLAGEQPGYPKLPVFGGDWSQFHTDVQSYVGDFKAGFLGYGVQEPHDNNETISAPPGTEFQNLPGNYLAQ